MRKKIFFLLSFMLFLIAIKIAYPKSEVHGGDGRIEIYEHWNIYTLDAPPPEMVPIVLQVPDAFRYGSSVGSTRNWGLNILTYYPTFTSLQAPENAPYGLKCAGDCNGRIMISIENSAHGIHHPENNRGNDYPNMGDRTYRIDRDSYIPIRGSSTFRDIGPQRGFDSSWEVHIPGNDSVDEITYLHLGRLSGDHIHYDLAAECDINAYAKTCTLHFSLKCNPIIYVKVVAINMRYFSMFADVVSKADNFVSSMVLYPPCQ